MTEKISELQRLRDNAEDAFKAWKNAPPAQKIEKWQQYEDAEAAYWRAVRKYNEGKATR